MEKTKMKNFSSSASRQRIRSSTISGRRYHTSSSSTSTQNGSCQQAAVNVDSKNLGLPCILNVNISDTKLNGHVTVNGKVIKLLNSTNNNFNLSPYLLIGKNTIEVLAPYSPGLSLIEVELLGPDTRVVQQTSGTGVLRHTLVVIVR